MTPYVRDIYRYPIKSCRGMRITVAEIDRRGIVGDRQFMVVDEKGVFVTQRPNKKYGSVGIASMCRIVPKFRKNGIMVTAPDMRSAVFPIDETAGKTSTARVWDNTCAVQEVDKKVSGWFTEYLSRERPGKYRLVRMADDFHRRDAADTAELGFADAFSFLVVSQESLDELNRRMGEPYVGMDRFRPNIVIAGCEAPHAEDTMDRIRINSIEFHGHWLCDRCPIPGIDQETGERDSHVLKTLATYRKTKLRSSKVQFGRNYNHLSQGLIHTGCEVKIL